MPIKSNKLKVLNLDDEPTIVELIETFLKSIENIGSIINFTDSTKALQYCQSHSDEIDLIITGEGMPGIGGRNFLRLVDRYFNRPVYSILHSGYLKDFPSEIQKFYDLSTKNIIPIKFLPKPFSIDDLRLAIST